MGLFDIFNQSPEAKIRKQITKAFDQAVKDAFKMDATMASDPLFGGLLVQSALGILYKKLKESSDMAFLALMYQEKGINYYKILNEEYKKALNKYLKI